MSTYFISDEAGWNAVAAASSLVSFTSSHRIRMMSDVTFTSAPGHIRLGAGFFNGNGYTLNMNFAAEYSGGLFRLAGGTIRNVNINFVQPWAGISVLLGGTSTQYGTISHISVAGTMSHSSSSILDSTVPPTSQTLIIDHVAVNVSVSGNFLGLIARAYRSHIISNCSIVVNASAANLRVTCLVEDLYPSSLTSGAINISKCTATVMGDTSCTSSVFRFVRPLFSPSTTSISEIAYFRTQAVSGDAVANFIFRLDTFQVASQNVIFNASDCFASCDNTFVVLNGSSSAISSSTISFTRCVHVGRGTPTFFASLSSSTAAALVTITNCYGRSGQAVTTTVGNGLDPVVTGTLQTPNFLVPASALDSSLWTDDDAPPVGALYPFITSLIDPTVFTGFTNTSAAPGILVPITTFDDGIIICFMAGTKIKLADGGLHAVETLKPGMMLQSATAAAPLKVLNILRSVTRRTVHFPAWTFQGQFAGLTVTPWHLIFIKGIRKWQHAGLVYPAALTRHKIDIPVYNIHTDQWGCIFANGVPCETVACTTEQKALRKAMTGFT